MTMNDTQKIWGGFCKKIVTDATVFWEVCDTGVTAQNYDVIKVGRNSKQIAVLAEIVCCFRFGFI